MTIGVRSILEPSSLFRTLSRPPRAVFAAFSVGRHRILLRLVTLAFLVTSAAVAVSLVRSYRFYARVIDGRLASGYLTSRPGIYAAPRSISVGQRLSRASLVATLHRSGYVEVPESGDDAVNASEVWSGSFTASGNKIEIHPGRTQAFGPSIVQVALDTSGRITELTGDGVTLDSFALEPEVLTNDLSSKTSRRAQLTYKQIPPVLVHAILSIEDRRFFEHSGLDLFGVVRALLRNAGDERIGQGGSTITQQLVKNTYLSSERTLRRKFAEAMLSIVLERRLSKEDIFALYCNEVYLGQRGAVAIRGVEQAARIYFGKDAKDLSLAEAATLAGMIQGPTHYSPDRHADAAKVRRNTVLGTMTRDGWITFDQAALAAKEPVAVVPVTNANGSTAPYFIDYVNRLAESQIENTGRDGERIYTTIDLDLQQFAEAAITRQLERLDHVYKDRDAKPQAALVALDPQTGRVLAMVGGRSYAQSQLNRAVDARRQPGSTFKPFVYAAALESGISPVQMFTDAPREFVYDRNRIYRPANFGGGYSMSDVTMRTGLVKSLNVVTVDVAMQTGLARIANLTEKFGLPKPERYPALALGTTEVTPLQLAAAYATFVNGGRRVEPKVIESVNELPSARVLDSDAKDLQVISPATAYMITNMLAAVIDHGTGRAARGAVKGTAVAGKTGTSRDGWFVGFTPNLVCAVWIGFDDNQQLGLTGAEAALPAWTEFMNGAVALRPELGGRTFACPEGIKFVEIDNATGLLSTLSCPNRELIAITDALAPNAECYRHGNIRETLEANQDGAPSIGNSSATSRQRNKQNSDTRQYSPSMITRVDVDARGRRTLVNEMR
jgi:penicillin-binding protein 1B